MVNGGSTKIIKSQKLLINAFLDSLKTKDFKDIQIKEICLKAKLTRQTFYSLFSTKENMLNFHLKYNCPFILDKIGTNNSKITIDDLSNRFEEFYLENKEFLKVLIDNKFYDYIFNHFYNSINNARIPIIKEGTDKHAGSMFISGGLIGILKISLENDYKEIAQLTKNLFSGNQFILK